MIDKYKLVTTNKRAIEIIKGRLDQIEDEFEMYKAKKQRDLLTNEEVAHILTKQSAFFAVNYTPKEMQILFDTYKELVTIVTDNTTNNFPTRQQFTQFIGITNEMYESMLQSDHEETRRVMQYIEDYFQDSLYRGWGKNHINKDMAKHQLEAVHGRIIVKRSEVTTIDERIDTAQIKGNLDNVLTIDAEYEEKKEED